MMTFHYNFFPFLFKFCVPREVEIAILALICIRKLHVVHVVVFKLCYLENNSLNHCICISPFDPRLCQEWERVLWGFQIKRYTVSF